MASSEPREPAIGARWVRGQKGPWLALAFSLLIVVLAARNAVVLVVQVRSTPALPQWDMAQHGFDGVRLANALRHLDLPAFLTTLNGMSVWPPLFPLLEAPVLLLAGYDYTVPRYLMVVLYVLLVVAALAAGWAIAPRHGPAVGVLAAALVAASPFVHLFASLTMLEVPGALFFLLTLTAYAKALRGKTRWWWYATAGLSTALFFCKYNYGLLWLVPLVVQEACRTAGGWRALAGRLRDGVRHFPWQRPWGIFLLVYAGLLMAIHFSGGWRFMLAGRELRMTSLANPLYALYLLALARWLYRPRRAWRRTHAWLAGLLPPHRILICGVLLPIALWMLVPDHAKGFIGFLENRSSGLPFWSLDNLLYYGRVFAQQYSPWPGLGWLTLLSALAALPLLLRGGDQPRILGLALLIGCGAALLHPYKQPRFFFLAAPVVWLAAAWLLSALVARLEAWLRRAGAVQLCALAVAVMAVCSGVDKSRLAASFAAHLVAPETTLPALHELCTQARLAAPEAIAVVGLWNELSPGLVRWHHARHCPAAPLILIPEAGRSRDRGLALTLGRRLAADDAVGRIVIVELAKSSPPRLASYQAESAWLDPLPAMLTADPSLLPQQTKSLRATGYRLHIYRRSPPL